MGIVVWAHSTSISTDLVNWASQLKAIKPLQPSETVPPGGKPTIFYMRTPYLPDQGHVGGEGGLSYDYGKFYALKTFFDYEKNRLILWGWVNESSRRHDIEKGWAGVWIDVGAILSGNVKGHDNYVLGSFSWLQIDHSVVEAFCGEGKVIIAARVYPMKAINKAAHLFVFNKGIKDIGLTSLISWNMKKAITN
ncbi:hypothetical protein MLD38_035489 [Melastoma candidum]|uniref:Uncharacterized protein n=1 Tax=Melastoma candidum TaxID=119954 RepID=A0ACB9LGS6_9MYRT|nr:hypothetical protein MLD38_035489 [Melastoma candidum]